MAVTPGIRCIQSTLVWTNQAITPPAPATARSLALSECLADLPILTIATAVPPIIASSSTHADHAGLAQHLELDRVRLADALAGRGAARSRGRRSRRRRCRAPGDRPPRSTRPASSHSGCLSPTAGASGLPRPARRQACRDRRTRGTDRWRSRRSGRRTRAPGSPRRRPRVPAPGRARAARQTTPPSLGRRAVRDQRHDSPRAALRRPKHRAGPVRRPTPHRRRSPCRAAIRRRRATVRRRPRRCR